MLISRVTMLAAMLFASLPAATIYTYEAPSFTTRTQYHRDLIPGGGIYSNYWCPPTPECDHLTFTLTFAAPFAANLPREPVLPLNWSVSDGLFTLSDAPAALAGFSWSTDAAGMPAEFDLNVWMDRIDGGDSTDFFNASSDPGENHARTYNVYGGVYAPGVPVREVTGSQALAFTGDGAWSVATIPTHHNPEPATFAVVGGALVALALRGRKPSDTIARDGTVI